MKKLMEQMAEELSAAFEKAGYDPSYGKVTVSNRPDLCEYQCNGAMAGAKAYKKAPFMIADDVVAYLKDSQVFSMAEVVKPGFINLKVSPAYVAAYLNEMAQDPALGVEKRSEPEDDHGRLRRTERGEAASRRTSALGDYRREHQAHRTFYGTYGNRRCASGRLGLTDGTYHHGIKETQTGAAVF